MKHATAIAATLTMISWVMLVGGLAVVIWTFADILDEFDDVLTATQAAVSLGVPVVTCWGVLRGVAELLNLGTFLAALLDDSSTEN
jgi:O-antigen/teichoic acid export membrane protein